MEIDDKDFANIVSQLDSWIDDDCLVECVERAIVVLNRYRDINKIPIYEECDAEKVAESIQRLNKEYENDKWIN